MKNTLAIVWLRQDLSLEKNLALSHATLNHKKVVAIYIYKKNVFDNKREAQKWWIYKSLQNLKKDLLSLNINLEIIISNSYQDVFKNILKEKNFSIYWNKVYEPKYLKFDDKIAMELKNNDVNHQIFSGNLLNEATEVKKNDDTPFKVFTAFWRTAEKIYLEKDMSRDVKLKKMEKKVKFLNNNLQIDEILPKKNWYKKFEKYWNPSEQEAKLVCKDFLKKRISRYGENRDIPSVSGTSKISPYLAFGLIHVKTVWNLCSKIETKQNGYRKYINELGWREFSHSLINYFPEMLKGNLRKEFDNFPWVENKKNLEAWKKGLTGYPIVDAGMRELRETGWMHNRVRMITASFLVKHLRIHWKEGEKFFRNSLLDFNEANNVAGWQWVSGCGADAAPYFRIFNPILQGEKFDKNGDYVKKWVPELKNLSSDYIHKPWEIEKNDTFELGKDYPYPIVIHQDARNLALKAFKELKKNTK